MPNRYRAMADQAHSLVTRAVSLLDAIELRDFQPAQQAANDVSRLAHALTQEIFHARQELGDTVGEAPNPYRLVLVPGPTVEDGLAFISLEDHLEYCRYENWARQHHPDPYDRWWFSKHLSAGQRALEERGVAWDAWKDDTEGEVE